VVTETPLSICVEWRAQGEVLSPIIKEVMQTSETTGNVWTRVEWFAPGLIKLTNGATPGALDRSAGVETVNLHLLTPETDERTHYFFCSTRDFRIEDADLNTKIASMRAHIFATEDKPMIEAQAERMRGQEFWSLGPMLMSIDQGPVRVRQRLDAMIKEEKEGLR
jgi:vanillate O-demethylase monooxygenase subunit